MKEMDEKDVCRLENETFEQMFGRKIDKDVSVHPPNQNNNKGVVKELLVGHKSQLVLKNDKKGNAKLAKKWLTMTSAIVQQNSETI